MPKAKQESAAQRREQVRQQRRQQQNIQSQGRNSGNSRRHSKSNNRGTWLLIGGILAMVVIVVGIFIFLSNQQQNTSNTPANTDITKAITQVDPGLLATVGAGNAKNLMVPVKATSLLTGPTGKAQFLYVGGEYCPYCAAQRWAVIAALSRFGTFGPLTEITASEGSVPTFTFHNVKYTSQYVDFVAVEISDNDINPKPLDKLTAEQQQLMSKYDTPPYVPTASAGSIPFIDIANQYVSAGSYYLPTTLIGHSYQDITAQIKDPNSDISKGMLGATNYLTAAICAVNGGQPASVCAAAPIPQIEKTLPARALVPGGVQLATVNNPDAIVLRRQD